MGNLTAFVSQNTDIISKMNGNGNNIKVPRNRCSSYSDLLNSPKEIFVLINHTLYIYY